MLTEIITIGDEILIGQIVDTNSAWIAQQLNLNGIGIKQITSVSDQREHILGALSEAHERADIILITGGLGPTKDDITKQTLCEYFHTSLYFDPVIYEDVAAFFRRFNREVTATNRKQAELPQGCIPLRNKLGTAAGMWFEYKGKVYVFRMKCRHYSWKKYCPG
jgi:nicotinamide-nucleotide amidase